MPPQQSKAFLKHAIGPFPGSKKPPSDRVGNFLRESPDTGQLVWSWWNGESWGPFSDDPKVAKRRADKKPSKYQNLKWYGAATKPKTH
ncbi:hypothetical protein [Caldimonas sp. KR1-144]|uniref:hypothetical protein n=1 Tax=Caldimonas sp. KR1-144 TaxID=3400911 RepID=UPI003C0C1A27